MKTKKDDYLDREIEACHNSIESWKHNEVLEKIKEKDPDMYKEFVVMFEWKDEDARNRALWLEKKREENSKTWSTKRLHEEFIKSKEEYYGTKD